MLKRGEFDGLENARHLLDLTSSVPRLNICVFAGKMRV